MKSLGEYLNGNFSNGVIDHSVRVTSGSDNDQATFYIHPSNVDGETLDFNACGNFVQSSGSDKEVVVISAKEYEELQERDAWLCCLENAGVDNWCGYEDAQQMMRESREESE